MKIIDRRLRKLEQRVVPPCVEPSWIAIMREGQRRRAEAEGRAYVEPVRVPLVFEHGRHPSWADVMRAHRARRAAESRDLTGEIR